MKKHPHGIAPFKSPESWGKKAKVQVFENGVKVETDKESFVVPIVDVTKNRVKANAILKADTINKGSRFLKPSYSVLGRSYQVSQKK